MPSRNYARAEYLGNYYTIYPGNVPSPQYGEAYKDSSTLVWSNGHYGYPDFPPNRDIGGDFKLVYDRISRDKCDVGTIQGGTVYGEHRYTGAVMADFASGAPPLEASNNILTDGSAWGAGAYARMKPDKPLMNAFTSLLELRDLPGMLQQRFKASGLHEIGDYHLALNFGWKPLLQDVYIMLNGQRKAEDMLKQFLRDEGKPVRRRIVMANDRTDVANVNQPGVLSLFPAFVSYFYKSYSTTVERYIEDRVWASAEFRYWMPPGPRDIAWKNRQLRAIWGVNPTPLNVYKAIPWTWLADWFANYGDVISNLQLSVVDRLAASRFYVMRHRFCVTRSTGRVVYGRVGTLADVVAQATVTRQTGSKTRLRGDPFGLATQQNTLNGSQLAILGALGLSRIR